MFTITGEQLGMVVGGLTIIGLIVRISVQIGGVLTDVTNLKEDMTEIKQALFRRADAELLNKGPAFATKHSELHLGTFAVDKIMPFLDQFLPWYLDTIKAKPAITELELFWAMEKQFGDVLLEQICIENQLSNLGCIRLVMEACKLEVSKHATGDSGTTEGSGAPST